MAKKKTSSSAKSAKKLDRVRRKIKPASKLPKRFRGLIYGRSGAGKTRLIASAPKILIVDINDKGTDSVRKDYDPDVFTVEYWSELDDVFWYLAAGDHDYQSVGLDTVTGMQNLCMKFVLGDEASRDASRDPDMPSRPTWGKVGELMKTQITNFRNLPMNVLFTAQQRIRTSGEDEDDVEEIFYSPGVSPSIASHLEAAVGMIGYINKTQVLGKKVKGQKKRPRSTRTRLIIGPSDRYLTKDRYGLLIPHIDGPNITTILKDIYG